MSTPVAFNALSKLPQTTDSLEQINAALRSEFEQLETRLNIVRDARRLTENYAVDRGVIPADEVWSQLYSYLEALS